MIKTTQKANAFTIEGYNDQSKPCLKDGCKGQLEPTVNANLGRCNKCGEFFSWSHFKSWNGLK